jgi:hypothetical protein
MLKNIIVLLIILFCAGVNNIYPNSGRVDYSYPSSSDDKRFDEMESMLKNSDVLVLRTNNTTTTSPKIDKTLKVNLNLWRAALDVISFAPLISTDYNGGVIITDFYQLNNQDSVKLVIMFKDDFISAESIEVKTYYRRFKNNKWQSIESSDDFRFQIEDKILKKARELNVKSQNEK